MTGAAGCVGRTLMERLRSVGAQSVGLDIASRGGNHDTIAWIQADILDADRYARYLRGIDVVVHLAALAHFVPRTKTEADAIWRINLEGTRALLAAAAEQGVRRFIHVSTVAVLSPSAGGIQSAYAESKNAAEREVFGFKDRIEVVVVRPTTVYGPYDRGNVYRLIHWIDRGLPAIIGSGENRKSLVYSGNLALALIFLSEFGEGGGVYVVTDGVDLSIKEVVLTIANSLGRKYRWPPVPRFVVDKIASINDWGADRFGLPKLLGRDSVVKFTEETVYDPSALFSLGFKPLYEFKGGIRETVQWYKRSAH